MINIPIFLPSDNNYAPYLAVCIASILTNTESFIDFYILDSGITKENQEKICSLKSQFSNFSIEFLKIDLEKHFKNFKVFHHLNLSTYSRLLIPHLKPELKKALYIDTDTITLDDISKLYDTNLENYALGACWDSSRKLFETETKNLLNLSDDYKYFNAGVLLIDIQKWLQNNVVEHLFEIQKEYEGKIFHADETLLNKYFDNNYKILDIKWDYTDYDSINSPKINPSIRHFATPFKPWNSNFCFADKKPIPLKNFDDFWKYAKLTPFYEEIQKTYEKEMQNPLKKRLGYTILKLKLTKNLSK